MICQFCGEDISSTAAHVSCPKSDIQANEVASVRKPVGIVETLEKELPRLWTDELYSEEFRKSPSIHKDFDHALKHVIKAAVALQNMVEEADHGGGWDFRPVGKYLADVIVSTVRAALKAPNGSVDLRKAIVLRIEEKMKVRLEA